MRIRVLSDLHLEFMGDYWKVFVDNLPNDCDVLVLPGDLTAATAYGPPLSNVLERFCTRFSKVVYVPGNHEYYGSSPYAVRQALQLIEERVNGRLHWLHRTAVMIDGVRFLGDTLWFRAPANERLKQSLNDFSQIHDLEPWVYDESAQTRLYLHENVRKGDVVVTHHLPSNKSVHPKYAGSSLNAFFVCDVEDVIEKNKPALWIHGHTHESCNYHIGETRVVCNPYGYFAEEENSNFDPSFTVELP